MAQAPRTRIDQLPVADSITDADVMPIQQAGQTRRASAAQMMMYATKAVPAGSPGTAGTAGRDGQNGRDGRGVAAASIAPNGKLYVSYTDGSVQDAGDVTGTNVVVGNGPPTTQSANFGDIYLDAVSGDLYTMEA